MSAGSCVHQSIKIHAGKHIYRLQTHGGNRTLRSKAKVSSHEVTCPVEADKELVLEAQTKPRDLVVKTASSSPSLVHLPML